MWKCIFRIALPINSNGKNYDVFNAQTYAPHKYLQSNGVECAHGKRTNTKYQCYFGDSLRTEGITTKATSTTSGKEIYRSISLVCILCIHFFFDRSMFESALGCRPHRPVHFIVMLDETMEKSDKQSHDTIVSFINTEKKKNERMKLLCIYSNCNHCYYIVLSALAYVQRARRIQWTRHLLLQCENNSAIH